MGGYGVTHICGTAHRRLQALVFFTDAWHCSEVGAAIRTGALKGCILEACSPHRHQVLRQVGRWAHAAPALSDAGARW